MQGDGPGFALEQTEHAWQRVAGPTRRVVGDAVLQRDLGGLGPGSDRRRKTTVGDDPGFDSRRRGPGGCDPGDPDSTLAAVDSVQGIVRVARDTVLRLQAAVGVQKARADQNLADVRQEISSRRGRLLGIDSPPLWKAFDRPGVRRSLSERTAAVWQLNYQSVSSFLAGQEGKLLGGLAFLLVLIVILARLRDVAATQLEQDDSLRAVAGFFDRPVAAGFLLAGLAGYLAQPSAPRAWRAMLGLVVVVAALRLLPRILTKSTRSWGYVAVALFFLQQAVELSEFGSPENRLTLLLLSLVGLVACLRFRRSRGSGADNGLEAVVSRHRPRRPGGGDRVCDRSPRQHRGQRGLRCHGDHWNGAPHLRGYRLLVGGGSGARRGADRHGLEDGLSFRYRAVQRRHR